MWFIQVCATTLVTGAAIGFPNIWGGTLERAFLFGGFLTIGLFHGSADLLLLRHLSASQKEHSKIRSLIGYLGVITGVALFFWCVPQVVLGFFLLASAFHFGESQFWKDRVIQSIVPIRERTLIYLLWGTWVILTPILLRPEETLTLLNQLGSFPIYEPMLLSRSPHQLFTIASILFLAAIGSLLWLYFKRKAFSQGVLTQELISLVLLQMTFVYTSVLTSFGVYFILWHSTISLQDQVQALNQLNANMESTRLKPYHWLKTYVRAAFPYWSLSVMGAIGIWKADSAGLIPVPITALVFGGAILLTTPHLFTIRALHNRLHHEIKMMP